jgi:TM2 domain-containing membrane protein YozV
VISFNCQECGSSLSFVDQAAGTKRECPHCGRVVYVPEELQIASAAPGRSRADDPQEPPNRPHDSRSARAGDQYDVDDRHFRTFVGNKPAAGILGILLGGLGIHKFILGFPTAGVIMLVTTVVCGITGALCVLPLVGVFAMHVIGLVEGILYLTKTDDEFYRLYAIEKKEWF